MNWVAGKLTKPVFKQAFEYMQNAYPDSKLTQHVASLATQDNPAAPSEDAPFAVTEDASAPKGPRRAGGSIRDRAVGAVQTRAKTYALTKAINLVWNQLSLPLTIFLWLIRLLMSFVEERRTAAALGFKPRSTHQADVNRIAAAIKSRPSNRLIASRRSTAEGHMLRSSDAKQSLGPASELSHAEGSTNQKYIQPIDLGRLNKVLALDVDQKSCTVQAGCTFRDLLRVTTHSHLMPEVVPPYLNITVGGAVSGSAIGSTSWRKGAFVESVQEMEVILASGEVLTITREGEHSALFHALHGSHHSIASIVSLKISLVHAPRYVHLTYENHTSLERASQRINALLAKKDELESYDNFEAIAFSPKNVTICLSEGLETIDPAKHKIIIFNTWADQPFASYVQSWSAKAQSSRGARMPVKHCVSLMDYLARYENGAFWQGTWIFQHLPWPLKGNSFVSRLLVGWSLDEQNLRNGIEQSERHAEFERTRVVQDALVPVNHLGPFIRWTTDALRIWPVWLCPVLGTFDDILAPNYVHSKDDENSAFGFHYINVGVYGHYDPSQLTAEATPEEVNTEFLKQVYNAGGRTLLHGHNFHDAQLWAQMFPKRSYEAVRQKYGAQDAFPTCFQKIALSETDRLEFRVRSDPAREQSILQHLMIELIVRKLKFWIV